jgi:protein phosphatase methylesterase 1
MDNMSDLQKAFVKAKLAKYPPDIPIFDENEEDAAASTGTREKGTKEEEGGEDFDSSSTSSASSAGTVVPSPSRNLFAKPSSMYVYSTLRGHV